MYNVRGLPLSSLWANKILIVFMILATLHPMDWEVPTDKRGVKMNLTHYGSLYSSAEFPPVSTSFCSLSSFFKTIFIFYPVLCIAICGVVCLINLLHHYLKWNSHFVMFNKLSTLLNPLPNSKTWTVTFI